MKKLVENYNAVNSDLAELEHFISMLKMGARNVSPDPAAATSDALHVRDASGNELAEVQLVEETLTDGSKVYDVVLRFSNIE